VYNNAICSPNDESIKEVGINVISIKNTNAIILKNFIKSLLGCTEHTHPIFSSLITYEYAAISKKNTKRFKIMLLKYANDMFCILYLYIRWEKKNERFKKVHFCSFPFLLFIFQKSKIFSNMYSF